jgi:hypothetical protein
MQLVTVGLLPAIKAANEFFKLISDPLTGAKNDLAFQQKVVDQAVAAGRELTEFDKERLRVLKERVRTLEQIKSAEAGVFGDKAKRMFGVVTPGSKESIELDKGETNVKQKKKKDNKRTVMVLTDLWATYYDEQTQIASQRSIEKYKVLNDLEQERIDKLKELAEKEKEIAEDVAREKERLTEASSQFFGDRFGDAFGDFILGAKSAKEAFSDMATSMLSDMSRMLARKAFMQLFSTVLGSGGAGSSIGSILGLAGGGIAQAGKPHIVGEQGPELFVPGRTGRVIPNAGGGSTIVNVAVTQPQGQSNSGEAEKFGKILGTQIKNEIKTVMAGEMRYGGLLNRTARRTA